MKRAVKREVLATLIKAGRRDLAKIVADHVPVEYFIEYLKHKLTRWDMAEKKRAMKRGGWDNPYALGLLFGALEKVEKAIAPYAHSTDPADFQKLKQAIEREFTDFAPRRATLKAIDKYLATEKRPKLYGR